MFIYFLLKKERKTTLLEHPCGNNRGYNIILFTVDANTPTDFLDTPSTKCYSTVGSENIAWFL